MKKIAMMLALTALTLGGSLPAQDTMPSVPLGRPQDTTPTPTPPVASAPGAVRRRPAPAQQPGMATQAPRTQNGQARRAAPSQAAQPRTGARAGAAAPRQAQQAPAQAQDQVPAQAQPPAQAAASPTPSANVNIQIGVKLERIRVQRSRVFTATAPEASPNEDPSAWANEMALQMRLTTAHEWDVIEVAEASIRQAIDQNGQSLTGMKPLAAPGQTPVAGNAAAFVPPFQITENGATMLVRTLPPPASVQLFKQLDARIRATMGYRRQFTIKDVRSLVNGPSLTRNTAVDDVVVQVSAVGKDKVDLTGLGAIERVGPIRFEDTAGREIVPYNSETELKDVPPQAGKANRAKEWRFDFSRLPEKFNIVLTLYPVIMPRSLTVTFKDVPLP